ncbi:MAG TPA: hypothetical protein PLS70_16780, partial [Acidobacteriota bacterium]|nr:hypothetical protein [Acidobacteriota bacterium]
MHQRRFIVLLVLFLTISSQILAQTPAKKRPAANPTAETNHGQSLPLRKVILYSNGVAYFERRGTVAGNAEIHLPFKQSQIDDVLKSMVVLDLGKGRIGAISYNSSAPPSARLGEIPFSMPPETANNDPRGGLAGVLRQLQGAQISLTTANRTVSGAILSLERRTTPAVEKEKPPTITQMVVLASESGEITSVDLAEIRSVKLLDEGTKRDLNTFTDASSAVRRRDAKTIVVTSEGEGQREMVVSYTIAAPIWKTSYRVVMDSSGKPFFQGWAIVDNISEEDWENVSLSLVSGTPMSFIQPLQQPLYRYRPVLPIANDVKLDPQGVNPVDLSLADGDSPESETASTVTKRQVKELPSPASQGQLNLVQTQTGVYSVMNAAPNDGTGRYYRSSTGPTTTLSTAITTGEAGITSTSTGNEIGDLFEYKVSQPVTVRRDRSALVPILQEKLEGERVSLYNESINPERPLNGVRLLNSTKLTLESGILTVVDGDAYAGEGSIDRCKPGERRFVVYALDLGTLVTTKTESEQKPVFLVRKYYGNFEIHYYLIEKKKFTVTNQTDRPKTVYLEHPIRQGWTLTKDMGEPPSKSPTVNRFRVELGPRETKEFVISEQQATMDAYSFSDLVRENLEYFLEKGYVDETTRTVLEKIIANNQKGRELQEMIERADEEIEKIGEDQERLRENIKTLNETSEAKQLIARYVGKINDQETRVEELTKAKANARAEIQRLQQEQQAIVKAFVFEKKF